MLNNYYKSRRSEQHRFGYEDEMTGHDRFRRGKIEGTFAVSPRWRREKVEQRRQHEVEVSGLDVGYVPSAGIISDPGAGAALNSAAPSTTDPSMSAGGTSISSTLLYSFQRLLHNLQKLLCLRDTTTNISLAGSTLAPDPSFYHLISSQ